MKAPAACCVGVLAGLVGACSLAPHYETPALPRPEVDAYREAGAWLPAEPADTAERGPWWQAFRDPKLDELEQRLREASPDLQAAVARFEQASAVAGRARSVLFPRVDLGAGFSREQTSASAPRAAAQVRYDDHVADLGFAWEIDVFGRLRNAARAATARADERAGDLAAVWLSLQAELAADYFSVRGADASIALLEDTVDTYDRAYELTRDRYQGGIAAATDVDQADTQRQVARAELSDVRLQRARFEHAIAILLGVPPALFTLEPAPLIGDPPPVATGLPSTLLERRPDVASAERAVAAANAEVGVARAAWFPVFSLDAVAGYESTDSSNWFEAPSRFWAVGPTASLALLDFGGRSAANRAAQARFDEAAANYRATALNAYREVEDHLAGLRYLADEVVANEAAAASAQRAVYHAGQRYAAGVADYIEVTSTQTAALRAQRDALDARVAHMNSAVALVRALGGGWAADQLERPVLP
jgi:NodT family efflux transporter outer membrane factor (OMF) lipoprotein